tara:strand:- start:206 stop:898 length:693 start_codon:yes stop_codon:yes gene_type:complete
MSITYKQRELSILSNLLPNTSIEKLNTYAKDFSEKTSNIKYQKRGVMPFEMFTIYVFCKELNITTLLESGTARGYSIELLASAMPEIKMITVENFARKYNYEVPTKDRLSHLSNIEFITGNGVVVLKELAQKLTEENVGVFIDGPKDGEAISLATELKGYTNVKFVSCHDLHEGLEYCPYNDLEFRKGYEYLNDVVYNLSVSEAGGMAETFDGETIKNKWPDGYGIILSI